LVVGRSSSPKQEMTALMVNIARGKLRVSSSALSFLQPLPFTTCLNLTATLRSGQAFRWRRDPQGVWWGVIGETVAALWQQEDEPDSPLYAQTFPDTERYDLLRDYFRLDVDLDTLYADWIRAEPRIAEATVRFRGLRILRQPPRECFFSFLCATCNTVVKIERSVHALAARYGAPIATGLPDAPFAFHAFPTLEALANADESLLRANLWGYRAPRVIALARHLLTHPDGWLESLRAVPYADAHTALSQMYGIGAKVADCICLFSLDKDDATPIDTHIRQIAHRLFLPELANKSLTPTVYQTLADAYRQRFTPFTGWAQQYLFFAELKNRV
jgi:N-glycosylase/DNA lyase